MSDYFNTVEEAMDRLKQGGFIILSDNEDRENEGDLVALAQDVQADIIYDMLHEANGLMCVPVNGEIAQKLGIHDMVANSTDPHQTPFSVTMDGTFEATGVTTGVSAFDRARTIQHIADDKTQASDFNHPGHIQPLIAQPNGLRDRTGHTEAAVDLALLAGKAPAAVIIEVLKSDGTMARRDDLKQLSDKLDVPYITIDQIVKYMDAQHIQSASQLVSSK